DYYCMIWHNDGWLF
nr:immunoglobulin light chain junction region [Macaca mulatta]MOY05790.1 immunoglobulin light chain junction region [Macaca mulatta]MOY08155.1 immunoglobulin light chain junction region [Macaca mulatta]